MRRNLFYPFSLFRISYFMTAPYPSALADSEKRPGSDRRCLIYYTMNKNGLQFFFRSPAGELTTIRLSNFSVNFSVGA